VALAQELFSMTADVAEESDEVEALRPSSPGRARQATADRSALRPRGRSSEEGQLARMVRELHEVEDDIIAKLTAAQRLLAQLESRRIHEDGGYASTAEFEERMLACTPVLRAMRDAVPPAPTSSPKLSAAKRDPSEARIRQTKALTSIARALDRLRGLDGEIYQSAAAARTTLCAIEGMRIFDECGYASFEEFLDRALGPSPILASVVALVASAPMPSQAGADLPPNESTTSALADADDFSQTPFDHSASSLFEDSPPPFPNAAEAGPAPATSVGASEGDSNGPTPDEPAKSAAAPGRRRLAGIIVSVVLCAAATVAGAAAGVWSELAANAQRAAEPVADASVAVHASKAPFAEPSGPSHSAKAPVEAPKPSSAER
jgi:hypothetical protein